MSENAEIEMSQCVTCGYQFDNHPTAIILGPDIWQRNEDKYASFCDDCLGERSRNYFLSRWKEIFREDERSEISALFVRIRKMYDCSPESAMEVIEAQSSRRSSKANRPLEVYDDEGYTIVALAE